MLWADDCRSVFPPQMASLGEPGVRGRPDRIRWEAKWREQWGDVHYVPDELIDCGESVVVTGRLEGSGAGSGAAVDTDWAMLIHLGAEGITEEEVFFDRNQALERVGLRE
jgi:ketosteroid isomerase-like protein